MPIGLKHMEIPASFHLDENQSKFLPAARPILGGPKNFCRLEITDSCSARAPRSASFLTSVRNPPLFFSAFIEILHKQSLSV